MSFDFERGLRELGGKIDRLLGDVDFIKNRTASYLGNSEALTYLANESPVFVNTDDVGCPMNFLNGGLYEEDYFQVFRSFCDGKSRMLDIGANLGVYSLKLAPHHRKSRIDAFEPIPRIRNLFSKSVFLNGFSNLISIHPYAVSEEAGSAFLNIPEDHAGGASIASNAQSDQSIAIELKRLDDFFPVESRFGLIKLDVEGHELSVIKGMLGLLRRSPGAVLMFEKLSAYSGIEKQLQEALDFVGFKIYLISGRNLVEMSLESFVATGGYYIATRPKVVSLDGLNRDFFSVFPSDVNILRGKIDNGIGAGVVEDAANEVIFHGPYWWFARGFYRVSIDGSIDGPAVIQVCERFGHVVHEIPVNRGVNCFEFPVDRDLNHFEFVLRASGRECVTYSFSRLKVQRLG